MECELIAMSATMFHGDPYKSVGTVSSGGSESLALAILAYRGLAYSKGIQEPELICAPTAHPAINKACHYFNVKVI